MGNQKKITEVLKVRGKVLLAEGEQRRLDLSPHSQLPWQTEMVCVCEEYQLLLFKPEL